MHGSHSNLGLKFRGILAKFRAVVFDGAVMDAQAPQVSLTQRETDILVWSQQGKSRWAIGEILGISQHGVDFHLRNIYRKLGVTSRVQAVTRAIQLGLLEP